MTDLLNLHGKQTVANLQMSFSETSETPRSEEVGDEPKDGLRLDLDLRPADDLGDGRKQQNGSHRAPKIFSQVLASRGDRTGDDDEGDDGEEEDDRIRRRRQREAISRKFVPPPPPPKEYEKVDTNRIPKHRYKSTLSYPLPDSFPHIFKDSKGEDLKGNVTVTTSLSTDAALSGRLKSLRATVTRLIGVEDRETLSNELAEMADEYHEGWSSGSDSGEDD